MSIAALEAAVKSELQAAVTAKGLKLKVDAYGGQLDENKIEEIAQSCPAMWVVFTGATVKRPLPVGAEFDVTISVLSGTTSLDDDMARQGGRGGRHIGAYTLIQFVYSVLDGFMGDDGEGNKILSQPLKATSINNLFNAKIRRDYLAVYGLPFKGRMVLTPDEPADMDEFEEIKLSTTPSPATGDGSDTPNTETDIAQKETP